MNMGLPRRLRVASAIGAAMVALVVACALQLAPATATDGHPIRHVSFTMPVVSGGEPTSGASGIVTAADENDVHPGDILELDLQTTSPVGLLGITIHLCQTGFTDWSDATFDYQGQTGTRCVYEPGIVSGSGLTPNDTTYALGPDTYDGQPQAAPPYFVTLGAGRVEWNNADHVHSSLDCDATHPCDVVARVETTAGTLAGVDTINYAADVVVSTTTTTPSTTTTAHPTTAAPTTVPAVPVAAVTPAAATATPASSQGLALTGATSTRGLVSVALIVLAVGLLALAQSLRRSQQH
jgi:hypothetical protein